MHDIRLLEFEHLSEVVREGGHMWPQIILGYRCSRSGRHVYHLIAPRCGHPLRQARVITSGIDRNWLPEPDQSGRELRDMDVLPAGVNATNRSQWARVFRNQCDAHGRSHPSEVVLTGRYPAPLRLNPRPRGVPAISIAPGEVWANCASESVQIRCSTTLSRHSSSLGVVVAIRAISVVDGIGQSPARGARR